MKTMQLCLKILYFLPPIFVSALLLLLDHSGLTLGLAIAFASMWIGSGLLAFGYAIGGVVGILPSIYLLILEMITPSWLSPVPFILTYMVYYLVCGAVVLYLKKIKQK